MRSTIPYIAGAVGWPDGGSTLAVLSFSSHVGAVVSFTTMEGVTWTGREYAASASGTSAFLIFTCDSAMRRVHDFPADWRTLNAAALLELSWHR